MKAILPLFLAVCLALSSAASAFAQKPDVPKTVEEAKRQFDAADAELNQVYRRCIAPEATTVQSIAHLKEAQKLWVQYRDGNAAAYQTGQSDRQVIKDAYYFYAATVVTRSRVQELKTLFLGE